MFGNNRFFAVCNSSRGIDECLPVWELAMQWLTFFRIQDGGLKIDISLKLTFSEQYNDKPCVHVYFVG